MKNKQVMNRQTSSKELHLISCGWEKCTPEQSYGPGVRRYYTIHFVLSGQGYFYMNNRKYTLKAGQCFFIPPVTSSLYKAARNGTLRCPHDPVDHRNRRTPDRVDIRNFPGTQIIEGTVYFLPGILDPYDHHAGDLFLVCKAESSQAASGRDCRIKTNTQNIRKSG